MNDHEIKAMSEQVDTLYERVVTLEAKMSQLLELLSEKKTAESLGFTQWQLKRITNCDAGYGRRITLQNERFKKSRAAEREAAIDQLIADRQRNERAAKLGL